jgi:hypothetical protein
MSENSKSIAEIMVLAKNAGVYVRPIRENHYIVRNGEEMVECESREELEAYIMDLATDTTPDVCSDLIIPHKYDDMDDYEFDLGGEG